jgi:soluble lytic murein transglycosylase
VYADLIAPNAAEHGVDPYLVQALMREESSFNPTAVSGSNALGLMQLLPSTASDVAGWLNRPNFQALQLFDPSTNVTLGTRYLRFLLEFFKGNAMYAVGAYNGGPGAMQGWVSKRPTSLTAEPLSEGDPDWFVERIPYQQSKDYIKKVFGSYWVYNRLYAPERFDLPPFGDKLSDGDASPKAS